MCALISQYLDSDPLTSLDIHTYMKTWPGTLGKAAMWNNLELNQLTEDPHHPQMHHVVPHHSGLYPLRQTLPQHMCTP
jgi:hypothetical protein